MMYVRGSTNDYNDWAELTNDDTWSASNMTKYMRKHQKLEPFDPAITDTSTMHIVEEHHGRDGPIHTSFNPALMPLDDHVLKAAAEATGLSQKTIDPWSGDHLGFFSTMGTVVRSGEHRGKRSYAARGYFEPNAHRPNLKVLCEAYVTQVILDEDLATGVRFSHGGKDYEVKTNREVLVCQGAIGSPQLLELSGIGNPEILRAAGVEPKIDLSSVGENFQEHIASTLGAGLIPDILTFDSLNDPEVLAIAQQALIEHQTGPLTHIGAAQGFFPYSAIATPQELQRTIAMIKATQTRSEFHAKQLQQVIRHLESDQSANVQFIGLGVRTDWRIGQTDQSQLFVPPPPGQPLELTLASCLSYPASRGSVHITSSGKSLPFPGYKSYQPNCTDPFQQPAIDPAYLDHPADSAILQAALRFHKRATETSHLADKVVKQTHPPPDTDLDDPEQAALAVRRACIGTYHPCGSVAMGDALDSRLRVKGVRGLRVVDASVFPNNVSGNICSSVYAIAELAADLIKEDNKNVGS